MYLVNQESTRRGNRKKKKQGQTETGLEPTRAKGFETDNGVEMAILFFFFRQMNQTPARQR